MSGRLISMRVGDTELLVEAVPVSRGGSEPTASPGEVTRQAVEAFGRAQDAIVEVAQEVAKTTARLAERAVRPDRMEVEFGLSFSAQGSVFVVAASGQASLRVSLSYDAARQG